MCASMEDISIGRKRYVKEGKPERHYEKETSCWNHPVGEEEKTTGKGREISPGQRGAERCSCWQPISTTADFECPEYRLC